MSDEGPTIVEMAESDWVSPEDRRRMEQEARQREAERLEALRATHAAARPAHAGDTAAAQWSTVASDAFLAACTYLAIGVSNHSAGIAGWAIIGAAACLGVSRFARALPAVTRPLHDWLTDTATLAGMPLVAVWAAALRGTVTPPAWLVPGWLLVSLVFAGAMPRVRSECGAVCLHSMLLGCQACGNAALLCRSSGGCAQAALSRGDRRGRVASRGVCDTGDCAGGRVGRVCHASPQGRRVGGRRVAWH